MKLTALFITPVLLASLAASTTFAIAATPTARSHDDDEESEIERKVAAEPNVVVVLTLASGAVVVRGWDQREVRARSGNAVQLELQYTDAPNAPTKPVKRVEVLASDEEAEDSEPGEGSGEANIELDVPRGATVVLKVQSGDLDVSDVAEARIETQSGEVDVRRIAKALEVTSLSGDIFLKDVSGRIRLRSISGRIEAVNARTVEDSDYFTANATSGSIRLDRIAHSRIEASTVSGDVDVTGTLARSGAYDFKTHSGDVTLELPADSSFKLSARVVSGGEIITEFPVKHAGGPVPHKELSDGRLTGSVGSGEAEVNLSSFSGTLYLRKK